MHEECGNDIHCSMTQRSKALSGPFQRVQERAPRYHDNKGKWRKDGEFASVSWKATMLSSLRLELLFRCVCRCNSWNFPLGKRSGLQDRCAGDFPCLSFGPCRRPKAQGASVPGRSARDVESQRSGLTKVHSASWPDMSLLQVSPHPVVSALRAINLMF